MGNKGSKGKIRWHPYRREPRQPYEHLHLHTHTHEVEVRDPHNIQGDELPEGDLPTEQELVAMEAPPFNVPNGRLHIHRHYHSHICPVHPDDQLEFIENTLRLQPRQPPHIAFVQQHGSILHVPTIDDLRRLVRLHPLSGFFQLQIEADRYIVSIFLYERQPGDVMDDDDDGDQVQEQGDFQENVVAVEENGNIQENEVAVEENGNNQDAD